MKRPEGAWIARIIAILGIVLSTARTQGALEFTNLNFESANIPPGTRVGSFIPISEALPGWTASFYSSNTGTINATEINYDAISTGGQVISVNDTNTGYAISGPISGNYSAYLESGNEGNTFFTASISQTAYVPGGAESLQFQVGIATSPFIVTLGGQVINMQPLATFSTYTEYGGDVAAFGGQVENLTITETFPTQFAPPGFLSLDNIIFSASPVPEPGTCGLILCGAVLFGIKRGRKYLP
jgi:hypothetical protein